MKDELIDDVYNYKILIMESPELFHDGIDEELISLLNRVIKYLEGDEK